MKLQEAKETTVFEIEDGVIEEVNLYDKMSRSVDETTSPRGVEPRLFIEECTFELNEDDFEDGIIDDVEFSFEIGCTKATKEDYEYNEKTRTYTLTYYVISTWGQRGNNYRGGHNSIDRCFFTMEEAEEKMFEYLKVDFDADWDNSCNIFYTLEEAEQTMAERMNVDVEVYRSIARKEILIKDAKLIRKQQERTAQEKIFNDMANMYASQVLRVPFESKHETEVRVSKQFGRIDKNVFWRVINKVRAEQNQR